MRTAPRLTALSATLILLAVPAAAQGVMSSPAMPLPPSARDPAPRTGSNKAKRAAKPTSQGERTVTAPREARGSDYRERIDTRRGDQRMQLEDDPRAVSPMIQNGRPGMGMRF